MLTLWFCTIWRQTYVIYIPCVQAGARADGELTDELNVCDWLGGGQLRCSTQQRTSGVEFRLAGHAAAYHQLSDR